MIGLNLKDNEFLFAHKAFTWFGRIVRLKEQQKLGERKQFDQTLCCILCPCRFDLKMSNQCCWMDRRTMLTREFSFIKMTTRCTFTIVLFHPTKQLTACLPVVSFVSTFSTCRVSKFYYIFY